MMRRVLCSRLSILDPELSPFLQEHIKINHEALEKGIENINKRTETLRLEIKDLHRSLVNYCILLRIVIGDINLEREASREKLDSLQRKIVDAVSKNVYFLRNEINNLLFQEPNRYFNWSEQIIFHAYFRYVHGDKADEVIKQFNEKKIHIDDKLLKDVEKFINKSLPKFEDKMIKSIKVTENNGNLNLILVENTNRQISMSDTNIGRRWFFTYNFIKNSLKKGDFFLIDEPASFLHPDAQLEIKEDLLKLGGKGIKIIYSTHSPYLIPDDISAIRVVSYDENGTNVNSYDHEKAIIDEVREQIGNHAVNDFLLKLSKNVILVEGISDEECLRQIMRRFNINESNYSIFPCHGQSIVNMAWICKQIGLNARVILDNDNQFKSDAIKAYLKDFDQKLNEIKQTLKCHFVSDGPKGCLEDLFSGDDRNRYFTRNKLDIKKLKNMALLDLTKETESNLKEILDKLSIK